MATEFCQKCKQSHHGRICDYDEKGECAENVKAKESEKEASEGPSGPGDGTAAKPGR